MKVREGAQGTRDAFELLVLAHDLGFILHARPPWYECSPWDDEVIVEQLDAHPLVAAILAGVKTGHRWAPCTRCGQVVMVKAGTRPTCRLTPDCDGYHKPQAMPRGSVR